MEPTLEYMARSWEWFEDPGLSILSEITRITGITDEMVAGHRIDDRAIDDLLGRVVLIIAHNADFDRRFLEKRLPGFSTKHWACSRSDIDWKAEGIRSSALEFVAYSLGFSTTGIGLRAIVGLPSMRWRNCYPAQGGWHYRHSWNKRDYRPGGYGRGMLPSRRRISLKPEDIHGALESSGDQSAGIEMWRTPTEDRGVVAASKCDGTGSTSVGVAHHSKKSVFGSMLELGRTSGYRI
jgi:hypothetical protein